MRKKVGVFTLYGDNNYGNKLQTYAVQKCLESNNCDVNVIKYRNNIIVYLIKILLGKEKIKNVADKNRCKKFKQFNKFIKYDFYKFKFKEKNIYVYGSDQVWNYGKRGPNPIFLGKYGNDKKNIAFSASFGVYQIPEKFREEYKLGLQKFESISVREIAGKNIAEELTNREDIEVLVDPTMLLSAEEWENVSKRPNQLDTLASSRYILNYFLGELSEEWKKEIERIAQENNCEIINILDKNSPFYQTGPSEFLYLEKNAFMVCTDSFHSSVFSIIYDTPFIVFNREQKGLNSMNSRIDTLLTTFKLEDRRFKGKIENNLLKCDYTEAKQILKKEQEKAENFLKKALDKK